MGKVILLCLVFMLLDVVYELIDEQVEDKRQLAIKVGLIKTKGETNNARNKRNKN